MTGAEPQADHHPADDQAMTVLAIMLTALVVVIAATFLFGYAALITVAVLASIAMIAFLVVLCTGR